jgi:hypothetical protein
MFIPTGVYHVIGHYVFAQLKMIVCSINFIHLQAVVDSRPEALGRKVSTDSDLHH